MHIINYRYGNFSSAAYEAENAQRPYLTSTHKARYDQFDIE